MNHVRRAATVALDVAKPALTTAVRTGRAAIGRTIQRSVTSASTTIERVATFTNKAAHGVCKTAGVFGEEYAAVSHAYRGRAFASVPGGITAAKVTEAGVNTFKRLREGAKAAGGGTGPTASTAIMRHPFADGGTHLTTTTSLAAFKKLGSTTYGSPAAGLFVAPTAQVDALLARAASRVDLEVALGLNPGALKGGKLVRIDVDNPLARGLTLPRGGNIYHRPGTGLTTGNLNEGIIQAPNIGTRGVRKSVVRGK